MRKKETKYETHRKETGGRASMVFALSKGRRLQIAFAVFFIFAALLLYYLIPQIIRFIIDNILGDEKIPDHLQNIVKNAGGIEYLRQNLWILVSLFLGIFFVETITAICRRFFVLEAAEYMIMKLRNKLYAHIQKLPFAWHVKNQTGDIVQRSTSDVDTLKNFLSNDLPEMLRSFFTIAIALSMMLSMDAVMTLSAVVLMPILFLFSFFYYGRIAVKFKDSDEAEGSLQASVQENFTGVRVVRAFGREQYEMERFDEKNNDYVNKALRVVNALSNYWGTGDIICGLQLAIVLAFGIHRCVSGNVSLGTFQSFYVYTSMLIWPIRGLGRTLSNFSKATVSAKRIHEILCVEHEDIEPDIGESRKYESIEFKNATFKYSEDTRLILEDVSFRLEKGKSLGILGKTGSGKSTVSYLLTRLYDLDAENGEILVDGKNIKEIGLAEARKNIALVLQEPFLYSKTIRQNIISPNPEATTEELHHVSTVANIHEAIMEFPEQYDTIVGERGVTLSGGQKQRVAIARMLMQKAPVMIFDDSLSAVDTETDAKIRAALKQSTENAAVVIISHRISTLMHSDYIMVLREGKIEDCGTHEQLIGREGTYRRIYDLQSAIAEEYR